MNGGGSCQKTKGRMALFCRHEREYILHLDVVLTGKGQIRRVQSVSGWR